MKDFQFREDDFDAYLDGQMPPETRQAFEAEIAADPELAELLDLHRAERAAMAVFRQQHLRSIWEKHRPESVFVEPPPVPFFKKWKFWLAVVVLTALGFLFFKKCFQEKGTPPGRQSKSPTIPSPEKQRRQRWIL